MTEQELDQFLEALNELRLDAWQVEREAHRLKHLPDVRALVDSALRLVAVIDHNLGARTEA